VNTGKYIKIGKVSKVVPLRSIEAHLGDRSYSSYPFLTSALEGVSGQHHAPVALYPPGKEPPVPTVQEAGWAPEPVLTQRLEEKSSGSVGDRTPAVQSVVRHYTNSATGLTKLERETCWIWCVDNNSCIHTWLLAGLLNTGFSVTQELGCTILTFRSCIFYLVVQK
jgi:hypothetical protein